MKRAPLRLEDLLELASSQDPVAVLRDPSRKGTYARLFLRGLARQPFPPSAMFDIPGASRMFVYRQLGRWRSAGILQPDDTAWMAHSWNARTRAQVAKRLDWNRASSRRGRPAQFHRYVDPVRPRAMTASEARILAAYLRQPIVRNLLRRPMETGLRMLTDPEGQSVFRGWLIPAMPQDLRGTMIDVVDVFKSAGPAKLRGLPEYIGTTVDRSAAIWLPRLADVLDAAADAANRRPPSDRPPGDE